MLVLLQRLAISEDITFHTVDTYNRGSNNIGVRNFTYLGA